MKKNQIFLVGALIISIITVIFLVNYIFISKTIFKTDRDYQELGLGLESYNISYYTVYDDDVLQKYKEYKLSISAEKEEFRKKLEESDYWSRNKFYEYEMLRFNREISNGKVILDREDLYYYDNNGAYAIFDLKNEKLYYLKSYLYGTHNNYTDILGVKTKNYNKREIYSVREGLQYDGLDYYVYEFPQEEGQNIVKELEENPKWSRERLENKILENFTYTQEVLEVKNGYYHYELVCRTSDENKKHNFTKEEATGYEMGVYDTDKNILYYYWVSI